jgi:transposase InsO family protein
VHTAIDSHTRLAFSEVLPNEQGSTAGAFWQRAHRWFAGLGIDVETVQTDNGACYKSFVFRDAVVGTGATHRRLPPRRPAWNGKVERFNRTLVDEWAYVRVYRTETARTNALARWLHLYNHHRHHTAIGGPPIDRINNLDGQHN